ncbi:hypothetical protein [Falsiroseomonas sp. E2-1-a20]|uniref:hypothetical protein n=1 Tax=Falsiroseomonas sp. E2-1-a20 TaxID=3239300 RepID=UPI003F39F279
MDPAWRWVLALFVAPLLGLLIAATGPGEGLEAPGFAVTGLVWAVESWRYVGHQWRALPARPGFPFRRLPTDGIGMRIMLVPAMTCAGGAAFAVWQAGIVLQGWMRA